VLESREHAEARGAKPYAKLTKVVADLAQRKQPGAVTKSLEAMWPKARRQRRSRPVDHRRDRRRTGDVGRKKAFLRQHPGFAVRATGTMFGHTLETQFPLGWRWPRSRSRAARCFRPTIRPGFEVEKAGQPDQIVVVGAGHWQGEGMALVEAVK
jgi:3-oxoacyl-[acyl-carrier-protein] synthase II